MFTLRLFSIVAVAILLTVVIRFIKNENSPVVSTKAKIKRKFIDRNTHMGENGIPHVDESYYLLFELSTGSEMKFSVKYTMYKNAVEDQWGTLTFQGTRFHEFEIDDCFTEKN